MKLDKTRVEQEEKRKTLAAETQQHQQVTYSKGGGLTYLIFPISFFLSTCMLCYRTEEIKSLLWPNDLNPFAPEPPVTARADPGPFYPL